MMNVIINLTNNETINLASRVLACQELCGIYSLDLHDLPARVVNVLPCADDYSVRPGDNTTLAIIPYYHDEDCTGTWYTGEPVFLKLAEGFTHNDHVILAPAQGVVVYKNEDWEE